MVPTSPCRRRRAGRQRLDSPGPHGYLVSAWRRDDRHPRGRLALHAGFGLDSPRATGELEGLPVVPVWTRNRGRNPRVRGRDRMYQATGGNRAESPGRRVSARAVTLGSPQRARNVARARSSPGGELMASNGKERIKPGALVSTRRRDTVRGRPPEREQFSQASPAQTSP